MARTSMLPNHSLHSARPAVLRAQIGPKNAQRQASHMESSMMSAPKGIGGAKVVLYTPIDGGHRHTGNCRQIVAGVLMGAAAGLAIRRYEGEDLFYLLCCDENWETLTDTWHQTLEEAKGQAEFEYEGVSGTWQKPED